jgi:hypothetical protein
MTKATILLTDEFPHLRFRLGAVRARESEYDKCNCYRPPSDNSRITPVESFDVSVCVTPSQSLTLTSEFESAFR